MIAVLHDYVVSTQQASYSKSTCVFASAGLVLARGEWDGYQYNVHECYDISFAERGTPRLRLLLLACSL